MSMSVVISNNFLATHLARLELLNDGERLFRECAITITALMRKRVFSDGLNARGMPIGTYTERYVKQRVKQGWGKSDNVILVLTDQMRGDFKPMPAGNQSYGIGFNNEHNLDKALWNEERYNQRIFAHTGTEGTTALRIIKRRTNEIINGAS